MAVGQRCQSVPFNVAIGLARSHDGGVTFQKYGDGPILSYSPHEPFILSGPKARIFKDRWLLYYIAGTKWLYNDGKPEAVYKIRVASPDDGLNWAPHNKDLIANKLEDHECQASPDVFFWNNRYHMFFCYRYSLNFRNKERGYRIGYALSEDGITWTRDDTQAGIDVSDGGWDSEMVCYPHVFELDGKRFMLYIGNEVGRHGFGLAEFKAAGI